VLVSLLPFYPYSLSHSCYALNLNPTPPTFRLFIPYISPYSLSLVLYCFSTCLGLTEREREREKERERERERERKRAKRPFLSFYYIYNIYPLPSAPPRSILLLHLYNLPYSSFSLLPLPIYYTMKEREREGEREGEREREREIDKEYIFSTKCSHYSLVRRYNRFCFYITLHNI
jgi:hypothetical protein